MGLLICIVDCANMIFYYQSTSVSKIKTVQGFPYAFKVLKKVRSKLPQRTRKSEKTHIPALKTKELFKSC